MENQKQPNPREQRLEAAQPNTPLTVLAKATRETLANIPTPGSMEDTARVSGREICPQCQALIRLDASFCQNCGAKVGAPG